MFEDLFGNNGAGEAAKEGLNAIKEHLKMVHAKKDEGTKLLESILDGTASPEVLMDSIMLCPGTAPFEWHPTINEKLGLDGEPAILHVCIPKSIVLAFTLKNKVYAQVDKQPINEHESTRKMLQLIFMRGIVSFINDEDGLRDKIMAQQLLEMMGKMQQKREDE